MKTCRYSAMSIVQLCSCVSIETTMLILLNPFDTDFCPHWHVSWFSHHRFIFNKLSFIIWANCFFLSFLLHLSHHIKMSETYFPWFDQMHERSKSKPIHQSDSSYLFLSLSSISSVIKKEITLKFEAIDRDACSTANADTNIYIYQHLRLWWLIFTLLLINHRIFQLWNCLVVDERKRKKAYWFDPMMYLQLMILLYKQRNDVLCSSLH